MSSRVPSPTEPPAAPRLEELVDAGVVTLAAEVALDAAVDRLITAGIHAAAVVDGDGRPVGTVSLVQLLARRPGHLVRDRMSRPPVTARLGDALAGAAERALRAGSDLIVVTDDSGRVQATVATVDAFAALAGVGARPRSLANAAARGPHPWTVARPLVLGEVGTMPTGAGVIAVIRGGHEVHETLVWSEESANLRRRLIEMVCHPEHETPQLARLLAQCEDLRFRAAAIEDAHRRRHALDQVRSDALRVARPSL